VHGFRIQKEIPYAEVWTLKNDGLTYKGNLDVVINDYQILLKVPKDKGGGTFAIIDRISLKIEKGYEGFFKNCEIVDSWRELKQKIEAKQIKVKKFINKNRKF